MVLFRCCVLLLLVFSLNISAQNQWQVTSPNGHLQAKVSLNEFGILFYTVDYIENSVNTQVIQSSMLGVERADENFIGNLTFESLTSQVINENYSMVSGKQLRLQNFANEITLTFVKFGKKLSLIFRAYNDGIAFRYYFPETSTNNYTVRGEYTRVKLASSVGKAWMQPYDAVPYYERRFNEYNIGQDSPNEAGWAFPALFNTNNFWVLVSESDVSRNNYVSHINRYVGNGDYKIDPPIQDDFKPNISNSASSTLPWALPWRLLIIGKTPSTIVESSLVNHLATPMSSTTDTSWISSGIGLWSWWSDLGSSSNYQRQRENIEAANNLGLKHLVIDATWDRMGETNFRELISYGNSLGIKIWNWYDAGGLCEQLNEPDCNFMRDRNRRRAEFAKIHEWGVAGIKLDFFMSDKQEFIKLYFDILEDAAEFKLLVLLHGCTIPQGWQRRFPNLVSAEAVEGNEMLLFREDFRYDSPHHNVNVAFTRNVLGSVDFTPGVLSTDRVFHNTTTAHELALLSVFETGFTTLADRYQSYLQLPAIAKDIIGKMPVAWDETKFIEGIPDNYIVLARRRGDTWYISGINGKDTSRDIVIIPSFLQAGNYQKQMLIDGADARQVNVSQENFQSSGQIPIRMLPYGGFTVVLKTSCPNELNLVQGINTITIPYTAQTIRASNIIGGSANTVYSANKFIQLNAGFSTQTGSVFKAEIGGCTN